LLIRALAGAPAPDLYRRDGSATGQFATTRLYSPNCVLCPVTQWERRNPCLNNVKRSESAGWELRGVKTSRPNRNYLGVAGNAAHCDKTAGRQASMDLGQQKPVDYGDTKGVFYANSKTHIKDITDGTKQIV